MDTKLQKLFQTTKLKGLSQHIAYSLYYCNSTSLLRKSYRNSIYCRDILSVSDSRVKSAYCKNRWCPTCNRIKTASYINRYLPVLQVEPNLYFLTLTRPNVIGTELRDEVKELLRLFRLITHNTKFIRKLIEETNTVGIRKLECTYNPQRNDYHPHLHIILSNKTVAEAIVSKWLNLNPTASLTAQCLKPISELQGGVLELFKYFTKLLAKDSKGKVYFDPISMDTVFTAFRGVRIYGSIGNIRKSEIDTLNDEIEPLDEGVPIGFYKYNDLGEYIGYYPIDENSIMKHLIEIDKPSYLYDLESN